MTEKTDGIPSILLPPPLSSRPSNEWPPPQPIDSERGLVNKVKSFFSRLNVGITERTARAKEAKDQELKERLWKVQNSVEVRNFYNDALENLRKSTFHSDDLQKAIEYIRDRDYLQAYEDHTNPSAPTKLPIAAQLLAEIALTSAEKEGEYRSLTLAREANNGELNVDILHQTYELLGLNPDSLPTKASNSALRIFMVGGGKREVDRHKLPRLGVDLEFVNKAGRDKSVGEEMRYIPGSVGVIITKQFTRYSNK